MTLTADSPRAASGRASPSQHLRVSFAAVRVSFTWLGVRKTLTSQQKTQAAERFGAEGQYLSAAKKLLDTRHPAFRKVTALRGRIVGYWRGLSLPYPEPGLRLIRQDRVQGFDQQMNQWQVELCRGVRDLDRQFGQLKSGASDRLGSLFDAADYPPSLLGLFAVEWDFPSVEPPNYLMQLDPQLYRQEQERVTARFEEAVKLAEEAFAAEFARLLAHLGERLTGGGGGGSGEAGPKVFRDSAVGNLQAFFERFRQLNVRSSPQLDELVDQARKVVGGLDPRDLRTGANVREQVRQELAKVSRSLETLLIDRPRRRILRGTPGAERPLEDSPLQEGHP